MGSPYLSSLRRADEPVLTPATDRSHVSLTVLTAIMRFPNVRADAPLPAEGGRKTLLMALPRATPGTAQVTAAGDLAATSA
jgi:hypothetical protein